jgi:hypothetical protein
LESRTFFAALLAVRGPCGGQGATPPEKSFTIIILPHFLKNFKSHRLKLSQIFCEDSEYQILMEKSRDTSLQIGENAV